MNWISFPKIIYGFLCCFQADEFNRVQRGHQNMFESINSVTFMSLVAGLDYPRAAGACGVLYAIGSYFYMTGYADTKQDVKMARYKKPLSVLKPIAMLGSLILCCKTIYDM